MKLKPSKCTSFSLSGRKPCDVLFFIGENRISSIRDEEQKFLGKLLFFNRKPEETFQMFEDAINKGIENIDKPWYEMSTSFEFTPNISPFQTFFADSTHTLSDASQDP